MEVEKDITGGGRLFSNNVIKMFDEMIPALNNSFPIEFSIASFKVHFQADQKAQPKNNHAM